MRGPRVRSPPRSPAPARAFTAPRSQTGQKRPSALPKTAGPQNSQSRIGASPAAELMLFLSNRPAPAGRYSCAFIRVSLFAFIIAPGCQQLVLPSRGSHNGNVGAERICENGESIGTYPEGSVDRSRPVSVAARRSTRPELINRSRQGLVRRGFARRDRRSRQPGAHREDAVGRSPTRNGGYRLVDLRPGTYT